MSEITHLHILTAKTMLSHSNVWLGNPDIVQMIESHPMGAGVLTEVRSAHDQLARAVSWKLRLGARILDMTQRIAQLDADHDRFLRMLFFILTALAEGADDPGEAAQYLTARDLLVPGGLAQTRYSYADQHGAVIEVQDRMTSEVELLLQQTEVAGRSLLDVYQRWVAAGQQLGELIKDRERTRASMTADAEVPTHLREARRAWLQVVRMFISAVRIMNLPDDGWQQIFAPVQRDIRNALEAMRERTGEPDGSPDDMPDDLLDDDLPDEMPDDFPVDLPEPVIESSARADYQS